MAEQIHQHHTVNMSVRMVAYSDERTIGDFLQNILVQHFVFQSYIVQDGLSKIRSLAADVPVIQIIDLINRQHPHKSSA